MKCYMNLYRHLAADDLNRVLQAPEQPPLTSFALDITPDSVQSSAFPVYTKFIEITPDDDIFIDIGKDPEATELNLIRGGERVIYGVAPGLKIAIRGA